MRVRRMTRTAMMVGVVLSLVSAAGAQDDGRFDLGLSYSGIFSKASTSAVSGTTLKPTTSGGILGTFRYRFTHAQGVEVNIGRSNNSQVYSIPPDTFRVNIGITELSAAYVLSPFHAKRFDPFVLAGGGRLHFGVGNQYIDGFQSSFGAKSESALAALYGAGADYRVWRFVAIRIQYRGLFYKAPNFTQQRLFTGAYGHMAEPTAGLVLKF